MIGIVKWIWYSYIFKYPSKWLICRIRRRKSLAWSHHECISEDKAQTPKKPLVKHWSAEHNSHRMLQCIFIWLLYLPYYTTILLKLKIDNNVEIEILRLNPKQNNYLLLYSSIGHCIQLLVKSCLFCSWTSANWCEL